MFYIVKYTHISILGFEDDVRFVSRTAPQCIRAMYAMEQIVQGKWCADLHVNECKGPCVVEVEDRDMAKTLGSDEAFYLDVWYDEAIVNQEIHRSMFDNFPNHKWMVQIEGKEKIKFKFPKKV